jgi:indolepyruvate ferredoxin oxidoreductase
MAGEISLDDKYLKTEGRVFLSSIQALLRVLLDQSQRDRAAGLRTAGFVSGYRGSPIGTFDLTLWNAARLLEAHDIRFNPGLNEELAATTIRGTQQLSWFGKSQVEGVFGMWYGKGLGVDRAHEALKLANLEGTSATGGALVIAGDDHGGKSSVSSHQSEQVLMASHIPIMAPSNTADILEYGLAGYALSRYSGLYVALKCVTDALDLTSSIVLPDRDRPFATPEDFDMPPGGLNLRQAMMMLAQEELTLVHRLPAAQAFVRANGLDRVVIDTPDPRLLIVSAGKAYLDTRQALADLGLDEAKCHALGIRVYKPALTWPLELAGLRAAARGAAAILVVEEKRPVIEDQVRIGLFGAQAPRVFGKQGADGGALLPNFGELSPGAVRDALMTVLRDSGIADEAAEARHARFEALKQHVRAVGFADTFRPASFCSGCPHSTSTKTPDGSLTMGATGCHAIPAYIPGSGTMRPVTMGAEGMPFVGVSHLVELPHMFANMGDGTYAHSGLLAIRAAVAAKANLTYKILYNDAVAMTGGQPVEGAPSPYAIAAQLKAEGVDPVVAVYDPAENFDPALLPPGVESLERSALDAVQKRLRERQGVSAIVYVQTCAAEKRRRRKRKQVPDPDKRVFINPEVGEGCGDCSVQSNCIAITPLETEFGRKRQIDQSACNKDFSCLQGFCPSVVTIEGARVAKRPVPGDDLIAAAAALAVPPIAPVGSASYNVLITGVGGTGVLTVGAILGMAAHIDGKFCSIMDMTGFAQKGGAVTSHVRVATDQASLFNARFDSGMTDALIGCDLIVSAAGDVLKTLRPGESRAVLNSDVASTGEFARNPRLDLRAGRFEAIVRKAMDNVEPALFAASELAVALTGDAIATNMLMLGYAAQAGLLPVSIGAIEQAIRINGTAVEQNLKVFAAGRLAAAAPGRLPITRAPKIAFDDSLKGVLASRAALLEAYQDRAYAER